MRYPQEAPQESDILVGGERVLSDDRRYYTKNGRPRDMTRMPKKVEALFILLNDNGMPAGVPLNRAEVDEHPITKDLPKHEKDLIIKYWPRFNEWLGMVDVYKRQQVATLAAIRKSRSLVNQVKGELQLDAMTLGNKLVAASQLFAEEVVEASLILAKTDFEKAQPDPAQVALYKARVAHVSDMLKIAKQLKDLGERHEQNETVDKAVRYALSDEAAQALAEARCSLIERGIVDAEVAYVED